MFSIPEQFSAATKTQLEAQLKILNTFASAAFEGAQKMIALNLSTTKETVAKGSATARELLQAKDAQEFFAKSTASVPNFDGVFAYGRELFSIASKTQAELFQTAQDQIKEASKQAVKVPKLAAPASAATTAASAAPAAVETAVAVAEAFKPSKPDTKPVAAKVEAKPEQEEVKVEVKADAKPEPKHEARNAKQASFPEPKAEAVAAAPKSRK